MTKTVLTYGLISGAILAGLMAVLTPVCINGHTNLENAELIGYSTMVLSFILVFLGIRSYREQHGGTITFGRAFQVGLYITLLASAIYVIAWEIVYYGFFPDFAETYGANMVAKAQASGASAAAVAKMKAEMAQFAVRYRNPLFNIAMTLMEVLPVGLVMTLVSAGILRKVRTPVQFSDGSSALASR
jgi:hypothetical protein